MTSDMPDSAILIVAAGRGERVGGSVPKQYRSLLGQPVLAWTVNSLRSAVPGALIQVVISEADRDAYGEAVGHMGLRAPAIGGATRQESVRLGLAALPPDFDGVVLIHDAARPFPSAAMIDRVLDALRSGAAGAAPGIAVSDSLRRCDASGSVMEDVSRDGLWGVQTPQAFRLRTIREAHAMAVSSPDATDDLAVAWAAGLKVVVVAGDERNFKITTPADFARAERHLLQERPDTRVGQGFDVHAFSPGDHVMLCGISVPHTSSLAGHSDADVALHALTDAILGAVGDGDIGLHFPPSDNRWRGASSDRFLRYAAGRVAAKDGIISHVDLTIICEAPKISPHREAMISSLSELLRIPPSRISVKGTTTEKLGFTGRREGIAAMAMATIRLPL